MTIRATLVVLAVIALPLAVAAQTGPVGPQVPTWAVDGMTKWYEAFNAGDADAIIRLYAPDAALVLGGRTYDGRDAIESFHRRNFAGARFACTWTIEAGAAAAGLTAVWGTDTCTETPASGGQATRWNGRWVTVFQKQPDGAWLIVRDGGEEDRPTR